MEDVEQEALSRGRREWCAEFHVLNVSAPIYIGEMGRSLDHHFQEHRWALKNGNLAASVLAEHVFLSNHQVDLFKAMVIDPPSPQTHRLAASWSPGISSNNRPAPQE